jgi:NADPH-dependent curcumin reductase
MTVALVAAVQYRATGQAWHDPARYPVHHVESADWQEGDYVLAPNFGVQRFAVQSESELSRIDPDLAPLEKFVGALGSSGTTGYFGMLDVGRASPGDVVVVSSAAGAVGSVAAQIGKIIGCTVIGVAGGAAKCAYLTEELRLDAAIDYKAGPIFPALQAACPRGIDVFFDNVGGGQLEAVLLLLAHRARVVISGMISQYNSDSPPHGPRYYSMLLARHARMEGFLAMDYRDQYPRARGVLAKWLESGQLKTREHIIDGIDAFSSALPMLFDGRAFGKLMLRVAHV